MSPRASASMGLRFKYASSLALKSSKSSSWAFLFTSGAPAGSVAVETVSGATGAGAVLHAARARNDAEKSAERTASFIGILRLVETKGAPRTGLAATPLRPMDVCCLPEEIVDDVCHFARIDVHE